MQIIKRKIRSAVWRLQHAIRQTYMSTVKFAVELLTERCWLLDYLPTFFKKRDGVLLVRLDLIGDFVLWLDSAQAYRRLYPDQKITLFVNSACANLASALPHWDDVISVDVHKLRTDSFYRLSTLIKLRNKHFAVAIQPTFSRELVGDLALRATFALTRIGYDGDSSNLLQSAKNKTDSWYSQLIPADRSISMELNINAHFVRKLGHHAFVSRVPRIQKTRELPEKLRLSSKYLVVAPGASWQKKMWPVGNFASVIDQLVKETNLEVLVCGGAGDSLICAELVALVETDKIHNLAGRTTISELVEIIRSSELVLTNDSAPVHIAAATGIPSVCILGGGHFNRFLPYNPECGGGAALPTVLHYPMECYGCGWQCVYPRDSSQAVPCIENISISLVYDACSKHLQSAMKSV